MPGNRNREIAFDNHLKTALTADDNPLSAKVKSGSIVVGIAKKKTKKKTNGKSILAIVNHLNDPVQNFVCSS